MSRLRTSALSALVAAGAFAAPVAVGATWSPTTKTVDIEVTGFTDGQRDWHFNPKVIRVRTGDTLRVRFHSEGAGHGFRVARVSGIDLVAYPGMPAEGQVVVDWTGGREFYCTFDCGPGHAQMSGMIIAAAR
jgi:heme/copper-type cytochrome/quinol oxidase subunit 2